MKRKIDSLLKEWRDLPNLQGRKILLLRGPRQVGKTYSVRMLGREFEHFLEVNLEREKPIHQFFEGSLAPSLINEKLAAYFGIPIIPGKTLLFFDEIQACPEAFRSLRFFHEELPQLHVIAAGSLLEFALSEIPSFGVGRMSNLFLYPLSFGEFLDAVGDQPLHDYFIKASAEKSIDHAFHTKLLERLRIYQVLGGMPAVINAYLNNNDLRNCQVIIDELVTTLRDDFFKYKKKAPVIKLREVFESIAQQGGTKFKYSRISGSGQAQGYSEALDLLVQAGLAYKVYHTSARGIPLGAQIDPKKFKVLLFDCGIYQRLLGLDLSEHMISDWVQLIHKGSLAEIFVGLELIKNSSPQTHPQLYYWHRESRASNAELDYVIQQEDEIVPIEVKAGMKGQMQSLFLFLNERNLPYGIRFSHENFGSYDKIRVMPLYAVEKLMAMKMRKTS